MKTIVITGATSGIGFAAAKALAAAGARVIGIGRSQQRCEAASEAIMSDVQCAQTVFICADLSSLSEVNAAAGRIKALLEPDGCLDALINNAGGVCSGYTVTPDGYETQFAVNHLAGFLLTYRLWENLKKAGGRVIFTGSNSHKKARIHWRDVMYSRHYNTLMAYKQSKLCNMFFAKELNRRFADSGVRAFVVDPGLVKTAIGGKQTSGIVQAFWKLHSKRGVSPEYVAKTYVYLVSQDPAPDGLYFHACRPAAYDKHVDNEQEAKRLFELSERLCGIRFVGSAVHGFANSNNML